jgi:hypothetical protein
MSLRIDNFLKPNFTMGSHQHWNDQLTRNANIQNRIRDNMFPRCWVPEKPRLISGEISWLTDSMPNDILIKVAGAAGNQLYNSGLPSITVGQELTLIFGPTQILLENPVWSLSRPKLLPNELLQISTKFFGATDGKLILNPTLSWTGG